MTVCIVRSQIDALREYVGELPANVTTISPATADPSATKATTSVPPVRINVRGTAFVTSAQGPALLPARAARSAASALWMGRDPPAIRAWSATQGALGRRSHQPLGRTATTVSSAPWTTLAPEASAGAPLGNAKTASRATGSLSVMKPTIGALRDRALAAQIRAATQTQDFASSVWSLLIVPTAWQGRGPSAPTALVAMSVTPSLDSEIAAIIAAYRRTDAAETTAAPVPAVLATAPAPL